LSSPRRPAYRLVVASAMLVTAAPPLAAQNRFFPDVPSFELPLASPRVTGITGRIIDATTSDTKFAPGKQAEVGIGEEFPVLALRRGPQPISLGFGVVAYARFNLDDPKSSLVSSDWTVGFDVNADLGRWWVAGQLYHESSHLGDEYRDTFNATRLDWTRELVAAWLGYRIGSFKFMVSPSYVLVDQLDLPRGAVSAAVDFVGPTFHFLGVPARPIGGAFADAWAQTDWKVSQSLKGGISLLGDHGKHTMSVALVEHGGRSTQRQFYTASSHYWGFELRFDL
jgi:hypothetical protein